MASERWEFGRDVRNGIREALVGLITRSDFGLPGSLVHLPVEGHEVEMILVSKQELIDWLWKQTPGFGSLDIDPRRPQEPEFWVARCDHHGEIARGPATGSGQDAVLAAWAEHDQLQHGGDGRARGGDLLLNRINYETEWRGNERLG